MENVWLTTQVHFLASGDGGGEAMLARRGGGRLGAVLTVGAAGISYWAAAKHGDKIRRAVLAALAVRNEREASRCSALAHAPPRE